MNMLKLKQLEFGSFLSYDPHGLTPDAMISRQLIPPLKQDLPLGQPPILMSEWIVNKICETMNSLKFCSFFQSKPILVPVPKSSLMQEGTLWVPKRIADALEKQGLGNVVPYLKRVKPLQKSSTSGSGARPDVQKHYDSLVVQEKLIKPTGDILLIDDVVTRGTALLGSANQLANTFPDCTIRGFAVMRTMGYIKPFTKIEDPCVGHIFLDDNGKITRYP
jgi:hypothetical protein